MGCKEDDQSWPAAAQPKRKLGRNQAEYDRLGAEGARGKTRLRRLTLLACVLKDQRVVRGREKEGEEERATGKRRQDKKGMDGPEPGT